MSIIIIMTRVSLGSRHKAQEGTRPNLKRFKAIHCLLTCQLAIMQFFIIFYTFYILFPLLALTGALIQPAREARRLDIIIIIIIFYYHYYYVDMDKAECYCSLKAKVRVDETLEVETNVICFINL